LGAYRLATSRAVPNIRRDFSDDDACFDVAIATYVERIGADIPDQILRTAIRRLSVLAAASLSGGGGSNPTKLGALY
jgi:hypothetical protein